MTMADRGQPAPLLVLLVAVVLALPFALIAYPPLVDYPNLLARDYIVAHFGELTALQEHVQLALRPVPNMALDIPGIALMQWLQPMMVSRLLLVGLALLFVGSLHALGAVVLNGVSWRATVGGFLLYSSSLMYGFVNYMTGVALFLGATAFWLWARRSWSFARFISCVALFQVCYFAHLSSLAFLGLTVTGIALYEFVRHRPFGFRQLALDGGALASLLVPFVMFPAPGDSGPTIWNTLAGKLLIFAAPVRTYWSWFDGLLLAAAAALLILAVRRAKAARIRTPLALASGLLLLAALCSPMVAFTSWGADARYVVPGMALALFAVDVELDPRYRRGVGLAALALMLCREGAIVGWWGHMSREIARTVEMFDAVPVGSTILVSYASPSGRDASKRSQPFEHVPAYAVITRQAFPSSLFTYSSSLIASRGRTMISRADSSVIAQVGPGYDYLWTYDGESSAHPPESDWCLVSQVGAAHLWARARGVHDCDGTSEGAP